GSPGGRHGPAALGRTVTEAPAPRWTSRPADRRSSTTFRPTAPLTEDEGRRIVKVIAVVGARPNFMKAAPVIEALRRRRDIDVLLVHTGQHYDREMSALFFEELGMPRPDLDLQVGSGPHGEQTGHILIRLEPV